MKDAGKGGYPGWATQGGSPQHAVLAMKYPITFWGHYLREMQLDKPAFPLCKERAFQVNFLLSMSLDQ